MQVERFSHIMHLVSSVEGDLAPQANAVDVFRATFPAGTLSGRRSRARSRSSTSSSPPSAASTAASSATSASAATPTSRSRSARPPSSGGVARVQAGGGLVADSVPETEYQESQNKAAAPLRAVAVANAMRRVE